MSSEGTGAKVDARVRNLRKRLAQIVALEERQRSGEDLSSEQRAKLARKPEVEEELQRLLEGSEAPSPRSAEAPPSSAPPSIARPPPQLPLLPPCLDEDDLDPGPCLGLPGAVGSPLLAAPALQRQHSGHWEDDPLAVEDIAPAPLVDGHVQHFEAEILEAVQPFTSANRACARMRRLVRATSVLSLEAFDSDVLEGVSRKGKWKLTLLAMPDGPVAERDPWGGLLGFIAYKVKAQVQCVSIAKLAVVPEQRGRGHGHTLVQWLIDMARKQRNILYLSLSSLPAAIRFYKHLGFRQVDVDLAKLDTSAEDGEEYIEGQVYMEYRCRHRACGGKKR